MAAIELSFAAGAESDVTCSCSCAEQCLRIQCAFHTPMMGALNRVSEACGVRPDVLLRSFRSRIPTALVDGEGRVCGDSICLVRSVGVKWPCAVMRKSRESFWACISCTEQGLACTQAASSWSIVRVSEEEAAEKETADDEDAGA